MSTLLNQPQTQHHLYRVSYCEDHTQTERPGRRERGDGRRQGVATNHNLPQEDPTPHRDRRIIRRIRAKGREARDRIKEGREEAKKRKKPQKGYNRRGVGNGGDFGGRKIKRRQERIGSSV